MSDDAEAPEAHPRGWLWSGTLAAAGEATAQAGLADSVSAVVIIAQVRSITCDLLELTGMDYAEARELIPEMD